MDLDDYTSDLSTLALGLSNDGQHSEALGVANRCLEISSANLECTYHKADELLELNRPQEAKTVVERGLRYPAITAFDGEYKHLLQETLVHINDILSDQPRQPAQREAEGFGSAFFVSGSGHIMTNSHVVRGCGSLETASGTPLKFIVSDDETDLALLQAAGTKPPDVATFRYKDGALGESIIVFGFPLAGLLSTAGNVTTGTISATSGISDNPRNFQITAPVQPGNSGGPLLDQSGNVVGMIVSKLDAIKAANLTGDMPQNVNFAIKGHEIVAFLNRAGVVPALLMGSPHRTTEAVAASAASFTLQIICRR
jgi:S1-C subfamily serine protease